jgi:pimeloyl-ACP methyl ester carboxylesterase
LSPERQEQTRARYPNEEGFIDRDGVPIFWERYGEGDTTVLMVPTWSIIHSRCWKGQIPYLARHYRVLVVEGRGNGKSGRPRDPETYVETEFADDILAVLDATGTDKAILVSVSRGIERSLLLATEHPERVAGILTIGPAVPVGITDPDPDPHKGFRTPLDSYEGFAKFNANYWLEHYEDFLEFFFSSVFSEPHSTKQIEDSVRYGLDTDAETLVATQLAPRLPDEASLKALTDRVRCPALVIHGTEDAIRPHHTGAGLAELLGCPLISLEGSGHNPAARIPVTVNLLIRDFIESVRDGGPGPPAREAQLA